MNTEYLTPEELVQRYKKAISIRTLANWRSAKDGPPYVKIGGRVLYPKSGVLTWEARRMFDRGERAYPGSLMQFPPTAVSPS